jgi:excisionase family DNA binding protein
MQTNPQASPLLLSRKSAAALLSVSVRTIDNLLARRELVSRTVGRRRLIPRKSLEEFARHDHPSPAREVRNEQL